MQTGPPRQRGALILRDVLSFSASEAAEILGTTAVSVNSSVQRARTRVKEAGAGPEPRCEPSAAEQRAWVDRSMKAVTAEGISRNSVFQESEVSVAFGLAAGLDAKLSSMAELRIPVAASVPVTPPVTRPALR